MKRQIDYRQLNLRPAARIRLAKQGEVFWGPGTVDLLQQIEKMGSVRKASESMQMSYSKCWKLLANVEGALGFSVVIRQQGGVGGGDTRLTPEGKIFLEDYITFEQECKAAIDNIFQAHYSD